MVGRLATLIQPVKVQARKEQCTNQSGSGIGVAAYHPEGARLVTCVAGQEQATAMSYFGIGGSLGFVVGPAIATAALLTSGLNGTLLLIAPALVMAAVIASRLSALSAREAAFLLHFLPQTALWW